MKKQTKWLLALSCVFVLSLMGSGISIAESSGQKTYSYETREIWCENQGSRIFGIAYVPNTAEEKKPLVIFSHELGNTHTTGIPYSERLAEAGYAAYTFDFPGGSAGDNHSDGSSVGMSIQTEATDLEAVLNAAATWDSVDPERIVLLGGSQGGVVTALTGCRNQGRIAGMILMYPALCAVDDVHAQFESIESIPEEYGMFGGWIQVGRNYATDIWELDFYRELSEYQGKVLLLHGDMDRTVDISYSEKAAAVIQNCEYHVIAGGGHEFFGSQFEEAITWILQYMGQFSTEQGEEEVTADMQMMINETPVSVDWEDNDSVAALRDLARDGLTIQMSMYGGFEQVGSIGQRLPSHDTQTSTSAGDIVLYSSNQIVVFYGSNSWAYTRLGKITDKTPEEMRELLGNGDVTITLTME